MPLVRPFTIWSLLFDHGAEVELDAADLDAVLGHAVLRLLEQVRRVQQRLGGDAADVEAGAAERAALVDAGHPHAELRCLDRGDVAARAPADHDEVIGLIGHRCSLSIISGA